LGEFPDVFDFTDRSLRACWFGSDPVAYEPARQWTDEYLAWNQKLDIERPRQLNPGNGWTSLRAGVARGPLVGGCLETIHLHLLDTGMLDFAGAVAFFETSELRPSPPEVKIYLDEMIARGILDGVRGLLLGRPYGYTVDAKRRLWDVVVKATEQLGIPVLADIDCGHTDPMVTIPLGLTGSLDTEGSLLGVTEVATEDRTNVRRR
jgi:muramoyltetrapeptide carboxypeptidase LdcA involved in peptidoglycan recycling